MHPQEKLCNIIDFIQFYRFICLKTIMISLKKIKNNSIDLFVYLIKHFA